LRLALPISLVFLLLTGGVRAEDPVSFIVAHSPDLAAMRRLRSHLSGLSVKLQGTVKQGRETLSGLTAEERARFGYDLRLIAELPLFSPRERVEARLRELELERKIRREAAHAVAHYRALRRTIARRKALVAAVREECLWLRRRVEAGLESSEKVISCVKELEERRRALEEAEEALSAAREEVLSLVEPEDRARLTKILDGK